MGSSDIRKYKHTKIEREILERANKHLAEMRREFIKSDFHNAEVEKPVEFEITDYDKALKNSIYPQNRPEIPSTTPSPTPGEEPTEPKIKQEPTEASTTPTNPEGSQPC